MFNKIRLRCPWIVKRDAILLLAIILFVISISLTTASIAICLSRGHRNINGVWVSNIDVVSTFYAKVKTVVREPEGAFYLTIEFKNNRFIATRDIVLFSPHFISDDFSRLFWAWEQFDQPEPNMFPDWLEPFENANYENLVYVGNIEGSEIYRATTSGTYALLEGGDMIELVLPDGSVTIHSISRGRNTITITTGIYEQDQCIHFVCQKRHLY